MAQTTSINLGDHFTRFLTDLTTTGRYRNTSEAVRAGLRLLEEQEAEYQTKLAILREALIEGEASGESTKTHAQIIADAKAELDAR